MHSATAGRSRPGEASDAEPGHPGATESAIKAIVGPGRSGTTWAGALIDSSPEVIYRFEPFHRLAAVDVRMRAWLDRLKNQDVGQDDMPALYDALRRAHPLTNKPPFFSDKDYPHRSAGRAHLWPVARALRIAAWAYEVVYSPRPGAPLVFKEVTFIRPLRTLIEKTSTPIVYLLRHPCATVMSDVKGQVEGKMPSGRQRRLRETLLEHSPVLAERFADVVDGSDIVQRTALLWRCEVEACVPLVRGSRRGMIVTNEQLADDAYSHAQAIFSHLGLRFSEQTRRFIDGLYGIRAQSEEGPQRTGWGDPYFTVYRNPRSEKDAWKSKISAEDRRKVEAIVEDSPAVAYCAALGKWD